MRRLEASRSPGTLATVQRLCSWDLECSRSKVMEAGVLFEQSQVRATELAELVQSLAAWTRGRDLGGWQSAVRREGLASLGRARRDHGLAGAETERRGEVLSRARIALGLVRARQKALDKVARRITELDAGTRARLEFGQLDEQWLRSLPAGGGNE